MHKWTESRTPTSRITEAGATKSSLNDQISLFQINVKIFFLLRINFD